MIGDIYQHWRWELEQREVLLIGASSLTAAWKHVITVEGGNAVVADPGDVTAAYVTALVMIADQVGDRR